MLYPLSYGSVPLRTCVRLGDRLPSHLGASRRSILHCERGRGKCRRWRDIDPNSADRARFRQPVA